MLVSWYTEAWIRCMKGGLWVAIHNGQIHGLYNSWMYKSKELPTTPPALSLSLSCMCVCVCVCVCIHIHTYVHTYRVIRNDCPGFNNLPKWDSSICIFSFNRTTLQVFVTYLTGALYVHPSQNWRYESEPPLKPSMLQTVWNELTYCVDVCRITKGAHIEHL